MGDNFLKSEIFPLPKVKLVWQGKRKVVMNDEKRVQLEIVRLNTDRDVINLGFEV